MKKILNAPQDYVTEMLEGLCAAHPGYYRQMGQDGRVIARPDAPLSGKVGIVSGGGSGHLPVFTGYVGKGLLTSCAIGEVFSSPNVEQMAEAIRCANGGAGVPAGTEAHRSAQEQKNAAFPVRLLFQGFADGVRKAIRRHVLNDEEVR